MVDARKCGAAFVNPEERRRYTGTGFTALISKPIVDIDAVLRLVRHTATGPSVRTARPGN